MRTFVYVALVIVTGFSVGYLVELLVGAEPGALRSEIAALILAGAGVVFLYRILTNRDDLEGAHTPDDGPYGSQQFQTDSESGPHQGSEGHCGAEGGCGGGGGD